MNALKKVEKLFKSFQKSIQNPDSNLRSIPWKANILTLETEFNKHKLNLKAGSLKIYKT